MCGGHGNHSGSLCVEILCYQKCLPCVGLLRSRGGGGGAGGAVLSTFCLLPNDLVVNAMHACSVCLPRGWEDSPALGVDFVY